MVSIWLMRIDCVSGVYLEAPAMKLCEMANTVTLAELCSFILTSFNFDCDQDHEFFMAKVMRHNECVIDDELQSLQTIFPVERNQQLFMRFDFGDEWIFKITHSRIQVQCSDNVTYPRVVEHIGKNPTQYPMYEKK